MTAAVIESINSEALIRIAVRVGFVRTYGESEFGHWSMIDCIVEFGGFDGINSIAGATESPN
jgi:hypothetical protein